MNSTKLYEQVIRESTLKESIFGKCAENDEHKDYFNYNLKDLERLEKEIRGGSGWNLIWYVVAGPSYDEIAFSNDPDWENYEGYIRNR